MTDWPLKLIQDVCVDVNVGHVGTSSDVRDPHGISFLMGKNVGPGYLKLKALERVSESFHVSQRKSQLHEGDIVVVRIGNSGQAAKIPDGFGEANCSGLVIIKSPTKVLADFLVYYLNSPQGRKYSVSNAKGSTRQTLNTKSIAETPVPVPPLEEQKRIVALLDAATTRVTELTACYEQARTHATNLFTKALDVVMFKDESSHVESALKHLTTKIGSGATPTGGQESYKNSGVPLIRSMNVHDSEFDVKGLAYLDSQQAQKLDGVTVEEGDVLLNITGASLTRTCIVPSNLVPARVNQHVSILRVKPELINERYLQLFLVCARTKTLLWEIGGAAGSTRQALTKKDLEELVVKYPLALEAQNVIVEEANDLASAVTEFVGLIDAKLTATKNLRQSILEAAFAGDL